MKTPDDVGDCGDLLLRFILEELAKDGEYSDELTLDDHIAVSVRLASALDRFKTVVNTISLF